MATTTTTAAVSQPVVAAPGAAAVVVAATSFPNASLYVGDLHPHVTETELFNLFSQVHPVVSVRVCFDMNKNASLGYGYVNFATYDQANHAMEILNFTPINGKPIRIMFSHRDPSIRKSGLANLFIKGLEASIDNKALLDTFSKFGTVLSCKVATYSNGTSKGYGFIQFEHKEAAENAMKSLDGMMLNNIKVKIEPFVRRQDRDAKQLKNVFVKNLSESVTKADLDEKFKTIGTITNSIVALDEKTGKSRGFGFVAFDTQEEADAAIAKFDGYSHDDKVWYVCRALKKSERQAELKAKIDPERTSKFEKLKGANLYLKNLDDTIDKEKLEELFSEFGTITSCTVLSDGQQSKGSGFVAFSTPEDAAKAVNEMNGKIIGKKRLYVAVFQPKEERRAKLQAQFAQMRSPVSPIPYGVGAFHQRVGPQQIYFGQGTPGSIPHHPAATGYGIQQPLLPGLRPGLVPNYVVPYHLQRQGQLGQRMGLRRGVTPQQIQQQQQFVRNPNQGFRHMANGRTGFDPSIAPSHSLMNPIMPPSAIESGPVQTLSLASALASATKEQQREMLGERLYPLVQKLEPVLVGKVTGMLLEMEPTEALNLIESPDELQKQVKAALKALHAEQINE